MNLDFEKIKTKLIAKREKLLSVAKSGKKAAETVELDQSRMGRLSRMDAMQAQAMSAETDRRREIELLKIKAALKRLDEGDYGYCVVCDVAISPQRLDIEPTAPICIDCANKREKR